MNLKTICLIALPSPFLIDEKVFPPLGVLSVATNLRNNGYDVIVHDGPINEIPTNCEVYGMSATTPQFPEALRALQQIRGYGGKRILIGGAHATVDWEMCRKAGFDCVVIGDGETAAGLAIKYACKLVQAPAQKYLIPLRDFIDIKAYKYLLDGSLATTLVTSRGCPYHCAFCCKTSDRMWIFPAEQVIRELEYLQEFFGFKAFMFFDDLFILDLHRLMAICNAMIGWNVKWRCFVRGDLVLKHGIKMVKKMKESGCVEVGIGVESGSDEILKIVNKGEDTETIGQAIELLRGEGIRVKGLFIVGLPGESPKTVDETRKFLKKYPVDDLDVTIYQPYKGSHIYDNQEKYDTFWYDFDLRDSFYKGKPGKYSVNVSTERMSSTDIAVARDNLEKEFKRWTSADNIKSNSLPTNLC